MNSQAKWVRLVILVTTILAATTKSSTAITQPKPDCPTTCGNLTNITFPFGTSSDCYLDDTFFINCSYTSFPPPQPFLRRGTLPVLNISQENGEMRILFPTFRVCFNSSGGINYDNSTTWEITITKFPFSYTRNKFIGVGCAITTLISGPNYTTGCVSNCDSVENVVNGSCSGIGCCETQIRRGVKEFQADLRSLWNHSDVYSFNPCSYMFVAEEGSYSFESSDLWDLRGRDQFPIVLDWAVDNVTCNEAKQNESSYACRSSHSECIESTNGPGYRCNCSLGFEGNPYLINGCRDIDECEKDNDCEKKCVNILGNYTCSCPKGYHGDGRKSGKGCTADQFQVIVLGTITGFGILFLLLGTWWIYKIVRKRNKMKLKQNYFKQNGGFLLQKQLTYGEEGNVEKTKHFTSKELEKATGNYNENRILGHGGQGTVYKGMLIDGRIVAVKKSTKVNEVQLDQFINEVVILSQIIHRNVVKLHGCCLETEVPLLVYEFIPNGTLFQYIHDQNEDFPLTWDVRLRIATEVATALSYLHYSALLPIYHRDIKSTNILLDDKYRAKVADFGTSRLLAVDQTHLTTRVLGTFGYLDPEYFQTSQFTEKSDVYSFAVVLVELLTGKNPISLTMSDEMRSLATYFKLAMEENRIFDIIDERVRNESRKEEIIGVANLARRCLSMNGRNRPTMKEVAMELEAIRISNGASTIQQHYEDVDYDIIEFPRSWETASTSNSTVHLDIQPLLVENLD